ncbi:glycosyltransferase [Sphingomonas sp. JC676]|uniref:glycosyltransferase n=1 Tax=Sphingomonas sp. JC676 TaxID=2768065 RepID=UPI001658082E|nr:glycosyltransferase [Sphingomonas sp. JC676]MBC9032929.1 glycosyltransferase [Sphingomonas sp. JC676]
MQILFLTTVLPAEIRNGGELWSQTIVDSLRRCGAQVMLLGYERPGSSPAPGETSVGVCSIETRAAPLRAAIWALRSIGRRAFTVQKWMGAGYREQLATLIADRDWDLVVIDHAQMGWTLPLLRDVPIVYLAHHAEQSLYVRLAASAGFAGRRVYRREARLVARVERAVLDAAVETWCISEHDADRLRAQARGIVRALPPLGREQADAPLSEPAGPQVALLGNWRWQPNRQALRWFLDRVQPLLPADWRIEIGGNVDPAGLPAPAQVRFCGAVEDGPGFLRRAERVAVPSLAAEGANLKLLDAIASGRPVVASASAIRLVGQVPADVAGADSAEAFAAALVRTPRPDRAARTRWMVARRVALDEIVAAALSDRKMPGNRVGDRAGRP